MRSPSVRLKHSSTSPRRLSGYLLFFYTGCCCFVFYRVSAFFFFGHPFLESVFFLVARLAISSSSFPARMALRSSSTSSFRVHYHRSTVLFQQLRRVWQFGNAGQNGLAVISFTVIVVERSANWFLTHQEWSNNLIVSRDLLKKYTRFRWHSAANAAMLFAANIWRRLHVPEPRLLSDELSTCCRSG